MTAKKTDNKNPKSRNLVRVDVSFDVTYTLLNDSVFEEEKRIILTAPTSEREYCNAYSNHYNDVKSDNPDPLIAKMWTAINKKMDYIIHLLEKKNAAEPWTDRKGICLNISGKGMSIISNDNLLKGQLLKININPPVFPSFNVIVIGKVVREEKSDNRGLEEVKSGVIFNAINEVDRELIIKYIFKRQREILRAEKGHLNKS